jgi:hypothetical protein
MEDTVSGRKAATRSGGADPEVRQVRCQYHQGLHGTTGAAGTCAGSADPRVKRVMWSAAISRTAQRLRLQAVRKATSAPRSAHRPQVHRMNAGQRP